MADEIFEPVVIDPPPISLEVAKLHLQITDDVHDDDVTIKLKQASDSVLDYLGPRADPAWDATTLPATVQAAMLHMLMYLYDDRGGEPWAAQGKRDIWREIEQVLFRRRDPTVA